MTVAFEHLSGYKSFMNDSLAQGSVLLSKFRVTITTLLCKTTVNEVIAAHF